MSHPLRIGNGAGFWGDRVDAPSQLARSGQIDVLTLEYLAELTMAILAHLRSKDPAAGFATDFIDAIPGLCEPLHDQPGLSLVTNAGGLAPRSCATACGRRLAEAGLAEAGLAVVTGDDVLSRLCDWISDGVDLANMETGEPIGEVVDRLVSANVYLGCEPIATACADRSTRIVITGRVADASLTLGPAVARFGWPLNDWDLLAGGTVAGHLIECGAQATGGLWRGWCDLDDPANVGYPIAEVRPDGSCTLTKPTGSGGLVRVANVSEQLVYEIDDPSRYRTPDVDADLTTVRLSQEGPDRVRVEGATGRAPSGQLKLTAIYRDGWGASGMIVVAGRGAEQKARRAGQVVLERLARAGLSPERSLIECLGAGDVVPGVLPRPETFEVVLRISVRDSRREVVSRFCREIAPLVTAGPPGVAGYATGRPEPRPAFGYWPALVPGDLVAPTVEIRTAAGWASSKGVAT